MGITIPRPPPMGGEVTRAIELTTGYVCEGMWKINRRVVDIKLDTLSPNQEPCIVI